VKRLIKETAELQERLVGNRVLLRHLVGRLGLENLIADAATMAAAKDLLRRELPASPGERVQYEDWNKHPASIAFEKMLGQLATDADATIEF
jgi:hypothetical protein